MPELHNIHQLPQTTHEKLDKVCTFSVAVRSIVDAAHHSQNPQYRKAALPYLALLLRHESGYRNARKLLENKEEANTGLIATTPNVFVERTGPEVSSALLFGGIHQVASHKTQKLKSIEDVIAEGVSIEAWMTQQSSGDLTELYANGVTKVRERFGNVPIYVVERTPAPDEKQSRLRGNIFEPAIIEAIEEAPLSRVYTGFVTRDDMHGMKPVHANVYVAL